MNYIIEVADDVIQANNDIDPNRVPYFVIEEAGELTKEITKKLRGSGSRANLTEELADLYYTLSMLRKVEDIPIKQINRIILEKEDRARQDMSIGKYGPGGSAHGI